MAVELGNGMENWLQRRSKSAKGGIQKRVKARKRLKKYIEWKKVN